MTALRNLLATAAALALVAGEAQADGSLKVESFHPTTAGAGKPGSPPANRKPGDPPCDFVHTRGRLAPANSLTFYATQLSDRARLPALIQAAPEASAANFRPVPAAVKARDMAVIAAMRPLTGGKVHAGITTDPGKATTFVFGSAGLSAHTLGSSRLAYYTSVPSEVAFLWAAMSTTEPLDQVVRATAHEIEGHARYNLDDNSPDAFYDLPGVTVGDTAGLSAMWSFVDWQLQSDDVTHVTTKLDSCDVQVVARTKYWNNPIPARR